MELDIRHLFSELVRKWWIIVLTAAIFALAALAYAYFIVTPLYSSTTEIYVYNNPNRQGAVSQSDVNVSAALIPTYVEILKSQDVLEGVQEYLYENYKLKYTPEYIRSAMSFSTVKDTEIFKIKVTTANPKTPHLIANAIFEVGKSKIIDVTQAGAVKQIDTAKAPDGRSYPSYRSHFVVGGVLGALISLAVIVLFSIFDTRIKTATDLSHVSTLPIFGVIPSYSSVQPNKAADENKNLDGKES